MYIPRPSYITAREMVQKLHTLDVMRNAGNILRESFLKEVDFGLDDSFCDKQDLTASWASQRMHESAAEFLSVRYNISKHTVMANFIGGDEEVVEEDSDDAVISEKEEVISISKAIRCQGVYQTMFYGVNNGKKLASIPVMAATSIHYI